MHGRALLSFALVLMVLALADHAPASAADSARRVRLGISAGAAWHEQEELNETISDVQSPDWDDWGEEELAGGPAFGAYAEYLLSDNWVVGAEFLTFSSTGGYDLGFLWSNETEYVDYEADADYRARGKLVSAYGVFRLPLGDSRMALSLGAGVGYVFSGEFELGYSVRDESGEWSASAARQDTVVQHTNFVASGSSVAMHALVGAEYQITDRLCVSADVTYRMASIEELDVGSVRTTVNGTPTETHWGIAEGGTLKWYSGDGGDFFTTMLPGDEVGLDFSGVYLTVSVAYAF